MGFDLVALSFVRAAEDIDLVHQIMAEGRSSATRPGEDRRSLRR